MNGCEAQLDEVRSPQSNGAISATTLIVFHYFSDRRGIVHRASA